MVNITEKDIRNLVESPVLNDDEIIELVSTEMDVELNPKQSREQWVKTIFEVYTNAMKSVEINKKTASIKKIKKVKKQRDKLVEKVSRKDYIIGLIEQGVYTKAEITEDVTNHFDYHLTGRSPKTRISRTIRELKQKGLLDELSDGVLRIKED